MLRSKREETIAKHFAGKTEAEILADVERDMAADAVIITQADGVALDLPAMQHLYQQISATEGAEKARTALLLGLYRHITPRYPGRPGSADEQIRLAANAVLARVKQPLYRRGEAHRALTATGGKNTTHQAPGSPMMHTEYLAILFLTRPGSPGYVTQRAPERSIASYESPQQRAVVCMSEAEAHAVLTAHSQRQ